MLLNNATWTEDVAGLVDRIEILLAERAFTEDREATKKRRSRKRLDLSGLSEFYRLRRRIIPRSRTWRSVKHVIAILFTLGAIAVGYAS